MTSNEPAERHLSRESLEQYFAAPASSVLKIDGNPVAYLYIDPASPTLALRTPVARSALPDVSAYQNISAAQIHWNDTNWFEVRIGGALARDGYPVLCAIADGLQLDGLGLDASVSRSLAALREVLLRHRRLSPEEEIGLFGELLLLDHLLDRVPAAEAVLGWRGPQREEHDFDVGGNDIEVKSTTAEQRIHWINDGRQLEPTIGRSLWLLSVQLTSAGADGQSLAELVDQISSKLVTNAHVGDLFRSKLAELGWNDESSMLHTTKYRLRSEPQLYAADAGFPAITRKRLTDAGFNLALVVQLRYALNLSQLTQATAVPNILQDIGMGRS